MKDRFFLFPVILLSGSILYCSYAAWFFIQFGRFPPPIFYDAADTFGDYFNTLFWSSKEGRFDEWKSIYPMFCFLLGKMLASSECLENSATALTLRDCNLSAILFLFAAYALGAGFSALSIMRDLTNGDALSWRKRFFGFCVWLFVVFLSISGLYAIERGNLIVFAFLFLSISVFTKNDLVSAFFLAMAISVKQYLVVLLFVPFVQRRFGFIAAVVLTIIFLNTLSLLLVSELHQSMLFENMLGFSGSGISSFFEKMWNPSSINAWLRAVEYSPYADEYMISGQKDFALFFGMFFLWGLRFLFAAGLLAFYLRKERDHDDAYMSFFILVGILVATDSLGGYAVMLLFPFLGSIIMRARGYFLFVCLLLLFFPLEIPLWPSLPGEGMVSYLTGVELQGHSSVTLGAYLRPIALIGVMLAMLFDVFPGITKLFRREGRERVF